MGGDEKRKDAIRQAAEWFARLESEQSDSAAHDAWEKWYAADLAHREAWQLIEEIRGQFGRVPQGIAEGTLEARGYSRRKVLGQLAVLLGVGAVASAAYRKTALEGWFAEYHTGIGQRRDVTLSDGSALSLNTGTAVDTAFSNKARLLQLRHGEILVATHPDSFPRHRPFAVETHHGRATALGTRFTVCAEESSTKIAVLNKAVWVEVNGTSGPGVLVRGGQNVRIDGSGISAVYANDVGTASWQYGAITAVDMPLGQLVLELARYRPGYLACDASVAGLLVSGSFSIRHTDQALEALTHTFPVRMIRRTKYWVYLTAR